MLRVTCILLGLLVSVASTMEGYIVGGLPARIIKHPHSVFFKITCDTESGETSVWFCGGAILNQMFIISAGHCFEQCIPSHSREIRIFVGHAHNRKGKRYMAADFRIHHLYSSSPFINDIALVRSSRPMVLGKRVKRIALMRSPPSFERALVAGWGWIDEETKKMSHYLKFVSQNLWSPRDCMKLIGDRPYEGIFCASADDETDYPSGGDSGSPLIVDSYIQVGLVSFKVPEIREVIVYTNVSYYFDWIVSNYMQMSCESKMTSL